MVDYPNYPLSEVPDLLFVVTDWFTANVGDYPKLSIIRLAIKRRPLYLTLINSANAACAASLISFSPTFSPRPVDGAWGSGRVFDSVCVTTPGKGEEGKPGRLPIWVPIHKLDGST